MKGGLNMTNTIVQLPFDKEKVDALEIYLGHKSTTIEIELQKTMDSLYGKVVPALVREFIREKEEIHTKRKEG